MSYSYVSLKTYSTTQQFLDDIYTVLVTNAGWTLWDSSTKEVSFVSGDVSVANNTITVAHTFVNGDRVIYDPNGNAAGGGLTAGDDYWIRNVSGNVFKLESTYGGSEFDITVTAFNGTHYLRGWKTYSSNGEDGLRIPEYLSFFQYRTSTAYYAAIQAYYSWRQDTHVPLAKSYSSDCLMTTSTNYTGSFYATKDMFVASTFVGTSYHGCFGGHLPSRVFPTPLTDLTAPASSGSNVVLSVTSNSGFVAGRTYQVVDATSNASASRNGRQRVVVSAIPGAGQITISSLPFNLATGSLIGVTPSTFCLSAIDLYSSGTGHYMTCHGADTGTTDNATANTLAMMFGVTDVDPEYSTGFYLLQPMFSLTAASGVTGYINNGYMYWTPGTVIAQDTLEVGRLVLSTDTAGTISGTVSSISHSGNPFGATDYTDKVVILIGGTGAGQIRKISSNTSGTLNVTPNWTTTPGGTTSFTVCDEGFKVVGTYLTGSTNSCVFSCKEGAGTQVI